MDPSDLDRWHMQRALELAAQGQGYVEPNPMVGCVIAEGAEIIGQGWHRKFGGPHAEVEAIRLARGRAKGATLYVTLEPCCHEGKTPPCSKAVIEAGVGRVVVAARDPFPEVAGQGIAEIEAAGIEVEVGVLEAEAQRLSAPYRKLLATGRPWILAKWAMTLDGKTATRTGSSRWISNPQSREIVHAIRGRVDAILVGRETARRDDPMLTARPPGARTPLRVVADTAASLSPESQLARTAGNVPVLVAVGEKAEAAACRRLADAGCEVFVCPGDDHPARLDALVAELGRRRMTNLLVEGGGHLAGSLFDARQIDEVHVFLAPKLVGGGGATSPIEGLGLDQMSHALLLDRPHVEPLGTDLYIHAQLRSPKCRSSK